MPDLLVRSFAPLLMACQPCFTQPSFRSFWAVACAWILCSGRRSLTRIIQSGDLAQFKHFCSFHRFFSQARWNLDDLGRCVLQLLLPFSGPVLIGAVDDTLARKSGRHIWGAAMHHDPLRSTKVRPVFSFGHSWVVLSLHLSFAFAPDKVWAVPILVRLYRKQKAQRAAGPHGKLEPKLTGHATAQQYRTRPQLALEMIRKLADWIPQRKLRILGDSEYAGGSISRHLPANVELISRMVMDAALFDPVPIKPARLGRPRKRGKRLSNPAQMANNASWRWTKATLRLYGRKVKVWYKSRDALWYSSAGQRLLRVVVVRDPSGRRRDDCFFSTDLTMQPTEILTTFSWRWPLEVCFRDVKQLLGFEDPQNRVSAATQRTAPFVFYVYDLVLLWFAQSGHALYKQPLLQRAWYLRKATVSFEDILRSLRHASWQERIFSDPALDARTRKLLKPFVEWAKAIV